MKAKLINYLVCPECKCALHCTVYKKDPRLPWSEIIEGHLKCQECGREYPISGGVPRLITGCLPAEIKRTVDGFGWEWQKFNDKIKDTFMTDKANFFDFIYPVIEDHFAEKFVLDAGCGMGRFLKLGAEFGSQEIIGIDLSYSVDVAYLNTRDVPNAHVVQADILNLPFTTKFDYIFSVGVLQFLPSPYEGFKRLTRLLAAGGSISVWVYSKENNGWILFGLNPVRKYITSQLPRPILYVICSLIGGILYLGLQLYVLASKAGLDSITGSIPYHKYLYNTSRLKYASLVSVIFDHLAPQLVEYISRESFENWFSLENLYSVTITMRNNMSWRGFGIKP